ncbi:nitrogenase component 1 [Anaerosinus massiliensis]|uniref:nitrogenase component 1 n=1 Tax=Massilibacillus massiliensis TaxID=1806837 RepID=UPI001F25B8F1|nr:nitrogenase component 1 [Massilibacillus massiliensis]
MHAGPGCSSKAFGFAAFGAGFQGEGYAGGSHVSCTNSSEQEVVFGGENRLHDTIEGALQILKGDLFVVLTGCTSDIVGDDSIAVAREFAKEGYPVVGVETAGFKGNSYYGHEVVVNAIIEQLIGDVSPQVEENLVNVFSVVPYQDPYWRGDLEEIKNLLEKIGLKVNILFGESSAGIDEWLQIPHARFNLLLSPWVGLSTVKLLEQKYNTPFLHYPVFPVGAQESSRFLREVASFASLEKKKVELVIEREEKRFYEYFISISDFISEYRNNLPVELYTVADSTYAIGVSSFLVNELGFIPKGIYVIDDPAESMQPMLQSFIFSRSDMFKNTFKIEADGGLIEADIRQRLGGSRKAIILGSSWEKFLAEETNNLYCYLSLPLNETVILNRSYAGYTGGLRLIEDLYSSLFKRKTTTSRTQLFTN